MIMVMWRMRAESWWFENLNERERKGERAAAAWRTRGGCGGGGGQCEDGAIAVYLAE